ncbi:MFS transporter [Litorivicinus lipolyticus]|uniref:MFS transporter n=1 Tax=Litorivicinus lipolyticus TaxID=418701 RepID=A0A5Q2Q6M2_9GAMM|nr:MFS transporter [Litorivicinus lipolyticus]
MCARLRLYAGHHDWNPVSKGRSVKSLLISGAILHIAGGLQSLLMPIRAQNEGFDISSISLMGSTYAIGFMLGCLIAPRMIGRVGHARAYTVVAAIAAFAVGWVGLWVSEYAWIALRSLTGFAFAAAATVAESWLNERASPENRGTLFGYYAAANFSGLTLGQLLLTQFDPITPSPFMLAGMLFAAALIPTALTRSSQPQPVNGPKTGAWSLLKLTPVGACAVFVIGLGSSAFGTLAPVYAQEVGLSLAETALFMTVALVCGALFQIPIGRLSDRKDRRRVLGAISVASALTSGLFIVGSTAPAWVQIALAGGVGATLYTLYGVSIALANEQIGPGKFLETAGIMLLVFGTGAVLGPLLALPFKQWMGPSGLFGFIAVIHLVLAAVIATRILTAKVTPYAHTDYVPQRPGSVTILAGDAEVAP